MNARTVAGTRSRSGWTSATRPSRADPQMVAARRSRGMRCAEDRTARPHAPKPWVSSKSLADRVELMFALRGRYPQAASARGGEPVLAARRVGEAASGRGNPLIRATIANDAHAPPLKRAPHEHTTSSSRIPHSRRTQGPGTGSDDLADILRPGRRRRRTAEEEGRPGQLVLIVSSLPRPGSNGSGWER